VHTARIRTAGPNLLNSMSLGSNLDSTAGILRSSMRFCVCSEESIERESDRKSV
jgi:hypothetical protein